MSSKYELRCFQIGAPEKVRKIEYFNSWIKMWLFLIKNKRFYDEIYLIVRKDIKSPFKRGW